MLTIYVFITVIGFVLILMGLSLVTIGAEGVLKERCYTYRMTAECLEKNLSDNK